jgi:hypothetical protein
VIEGRGGGGLGRRARPRANQPANPRRGRGAPSWAARGEGRLGHTGGGGAGGP